MPGTEYPGGIFPGGDSGGGGIISVGTRPSSIVAYGVPPLLTVPDVQNEIPSLLSRWRLSDSVGSPYIVDDIGGIDLLTVGAPLLSLPSLTKDDVFYTSVLGGVGSYFSALFVSAYDMADGLTLEGSSCADPNGNGFNLISIPGQGQLQLDGYDVTFNVWIGTTLHELTAPDALSGWPQQIIGTYDVNAGMQSLYVDGELVASQSLSGFIGTAIAITTTCTTSTISTTVTAIPTTAGMQSGATVSGTSFPVGDHVDAIASGTSLTLSAEPLESGSGTPITIGMPVSIASPLTTNPTWAAAQDVAIYGAPLSAARVSEHFQVFRQLLGDPGHVRIFPQIAVYS